MNCESAEPIIAPPSPEQGQLTLQGTFSATNTSGTTTDPSQPSAPAPRDSTPNQTDRKGRARECVSGPSVQVFITLVVITALSFLPATLSNLEDSNSTDGSSDGYVLLLGDIFKFDWQNTETVSIQWSPLGEGRFSLTDGRPFPNKALDIYVDNASQPVFSYVPQEFSFSKTSTIVDVHFFKTEHDTLFGNPQYYVPNDRYYIEASIFAIDKETNDSIPLQFTISDSGAGDFAGELSLADTVTDFTRIVGGQPATTEIASYALFVDITRSKRAQALTYFVFAVNWLLTLCSIITTAFIFRRKGKLGDSVAIVPITLILTIPTIRNFYPGSPPFGVLIDLVGFFPQMLSVAFCVVAMLAGFAVQYHREAKLAAESRGPQTDAPFDETVERVDAQRPLLLSAGV